MKHGTLLHNTRKLSKEKQNTRKRKREEQYNEVNIYLPDK